MANETVLIVDDEPAVLRLMEHGLKRAGYDVRPASDARGALAIVEKQGPVDVLLSDVVMPGMHGPELAREIGRRSPATRIVLTSGFVGEAELADVAFLRKPFSPSELVAVVERVLAAPR